MNTPASKTQIRLLKIVGLDVSGDYAVNAATLENAALPASGMPRGETWRTCAKMADADLAKACGASVAAHIESLTRYELAAELM